MSQSKINFRQTKAAVSSSPADLPSKRSFVSLESHSNRKSNEKAKEQPIPKAKREEEEVVEDDDEVEEIEEVEDDAAIPAPVVVVPVRTPSKSRSSTNSSPHLSISSSISSSSSSPSSSTAADVVPLSPAISSSTSTSTSCSPSLSASLISSSWSDASSDEISLRQFDLNLQFGPCSGLTRVSRWKRAEKLGRKPPVDIWQLFEKYGLVNAEGEEIEKENVEEKGIVDQQGNVWVKAGKKTESPARKQKKGKDGAGVEDADAGVSTVSLWNNVTARVLENEGRGGE